MSVVAVLAVVGAGCGAPPPAAAPPGTTVTSPAATTPPATTPSPTSPTASTTTSSTSTTPPSDDAVPGVAEIGALIGSLDGIAELGPEEYRQAAGIAGSGTFGSGVGIIQFVLLADGSYATVAWTGTWRGPCVKVYDAATLTSASHCPASSDTDGAVGAFATGLPTSGVESRYDLLGLQGLRASYGEYARMLVLGTGEASRGASEQVTVEVASDPVATLEIVADLATGMPLSVISTADFEGVPSTGSNLMVALGAVDPALDTAALVEEIAPLATRSLNYGFTRIEPDKAAALVDYEPPPVLDLDGFELTDVVYGTESIIVQASGNNPGGHQILVYTYRGPGMEHITVTSRLMAVENLQEGGIVLTTADDWIDPLHRGMTDVSPSVVVVTTTPGGHDLIVDTLSPLHAWGIVDGAVISVEGNVLPDTLAAAVDQILGS